MAAKRNSIFHGFNAVYVNFDCLSERRNPDLLSGSIKKYGILGVANAHILGLSVLLATAQRSYDVVQCVWSDMPPDLRFADVASCFVVCMSNNLFMVLQYSLQICGVVFNEKCTHPGVQIAPAPPL